VNAEQSNEQGGNYNSGFKESIKELPRGGNVKRRHRSKDQANCRVAGPRRKKKSGRRQMPVHPGPDKGSLRNVRRRTETPSVAGIKKLSYRRKVKRRRGGRFREKGRRVSREGWKKEWSGAEEGNQRGYIGSRNHVESCREK